MHPDYTPRDIARFWRHVQKTDTCWLWVGQPSQPYPEFKRWYTTGHRVQTHVASYELNVGPIPPGMYVCHACDVPRCVRPDHLWIGSAADNQRDMAEKGRGSKSRHARARGPASGAYTHPEKRPLGERHGMHILTEDEVREIKARYAAGGITHRELGERYGVSTATIGHIMIGRNWKSVT